MLAVHETIYLKLRVLARVDSGGGVYNLHLDADGRTFWLQEHVAERALVRKVEALPVEPVELEPETPKAVTRGRGR